MFGHHIHHCDDPMEGAPAWAVELYAQGSHIVQLLEKTMSAIDDLAADVAAEDTVIDSAVVLLNGIPGLIASAGTDPAKLAALRADIQGKTAALSAAVLAGTPTPTPAAAPVTPADATAAASAAVASA
jgi:hypothetical protein